jgi:hypothetical protein
MTSNAPLGSRPGFDVFPGVTNDLPTLTQLELGDLRGSDLCHTM